jgi:hypothetical protein
MGTIITLEPRLYAEDLFDGLRPEKEQGEDRRIEVKRDERLEEMIAGFERVLKNKKLNPLGYQETYERISKIPRRYNSEEIEKFTLLLGKYQDSVNFDEIPGLFLSALINQSDDENFVLHTGYLTSYLHYIGWLNKKNITIKGNAGTCLGRSMKNGKIIVEGDSRNNTGVLMSGGLIEIRGEANDYVGSQMSGGKIIVRGNAGSNVGWAKTGGVIHLYGGYETISSYIYRGDIYHKGKQIIKAGKPVEGAKIKWE